MVADRGIDNFTLCRIHRKPKGENLRLKGESIEEEKSQGWTDREGLSSKKGEGTERNWNPVEGQHGFQPIP